MFHKISSSQDRDISFVTFLLRLSFLGEYYIGLNDLQGTGTYKWADGTNASFTNWNTGHPKAGKNGVVMKMNGNSDDGKWQTKNYNSPTQFICECPDGPCA